MNNVGRPRQCKSVLEYDICTSLLPSVRERYSPLFDLLEIPEVLGSDLHASQFGTVYFRDYDGEKYDNRWSEDPNSPAYGGKALGADLSSEMVRVIGDFRKVDIGWLLCHPVGKAINKAAFALPGWLEWFQANQAVAASMGISADEFGQAYELIQSEFELADCIFTNGDFYLRNLIKMPRSVVVVDWEYWHGSRSCFVDCIANVAAFAFVHMWNNDLWQGEFLAAIPGTLGLSSEDFRKGVLVKSFEQASFWFRSGCPAWPPQVNLFRRALLGNISWDI